MEPIEFIITEDLMEFYLFFRGRIRTVLIWLPTTRWMREAATSLQTPPATGTTARLRVRRVGQRGPPGFGSALYHENGIGYVDLGTWNPSEGTGQLTVALWARYDGQIANWQGLIGKRDTWTPDGCMWILEIRANQVINFIRNGDTVTFPGVTLPVGEWAHVAVTFDGTIQVFYINGEEVGRAE